MRDQVLDRGAVYNRNTGFGPFKGKRTEPGPFPATHYAHLHSIKFVLDGFKYSAYDEIRIARFFNRPHFKIEFIRFIISSSGFFLSINTEMYTFGKDSYAIMRP